ncbi:hypothetical protein CLF_111538, partial [Clonorchis sinensis]
QNIYPGGVRVKARLPSGVMTIPIPESNVCNHLTPRCPVMSGGHYSYRYTNVLPQQLPSYSEAGRCTHSTGALSANGIKQEETDHAKVRLAISGLSSAGLIGQN